MKKIIGNGNFPQKNNVYNSIHAKKFPKARENKSLVLYRIYTDRKALYVAPVTFHLCVFVMIILNVNKVP